ARKAKQAGLIEVSQGKTIENYETKLRELLARRPHRMHLVEMRSLYTGSKYQECEEKLLKAANHKVQPGAKKIMIEHSRKDLEKQSAEDTYNNLIKQGLEEKIAFAMLVMVKVRRPLEEVRAQLDSTLDADANFQPGALNEEQNSKLFAAQKYAQELEEIISEDKNRFIIFDLLSLKEARGQIAGMLGYESDPEMPFQESIDLLMEAASMARRLGSEHDQSRALGLAGKQMRIQAKTKIAQHATEETPGLTLPRTKTSKLILQNSLALLKEAFVPLHHISKKDIQQVAIRADRIGALAEEIGLGIDRDLTDESTRNSLIKRVKEMVEQDITFLSEDPYFAPWVQNPVHCYYMLNCAPILSLAQKLNQEHESNIQIPHCPLVSPPALQKALTHLNKLPATDNEVLQAEMDRKRKIIQTFLVEL
ncbi:hypothetical protein JKY72_00035, partial [Candidatus Gracilibacteria bacterium]|nr:hypothetical protein [Candidatus Gracilibacteria bacterium]